MRKKLYFRRRVSHLRYGINAARVITFEAWLGRECPQRTLARIVRGICAREGLTQRESYRVVYALLGNWYKPRAIEGAQLTAEGTIAGHYDLRPCNGVHEAHQQLAKGGPLLAEPVQLLTAKDAEYEARGRYLRRVPYRKLQSKLPF
jgi:hypothetical protein